MDKYKAQQLEQTLKGKEFLGYEINELVNNGKSAAVFKASDINGNLYAVKIFDNDLIERFGHKIQEDRIEQEISLKGHNIDNLIKIVNGGKTEINSIEYHYIIMEFIEGKNLQQYISSETYSLDFIQSVVEKLFKSTQALLAKGIVHRDIKPENIMVSTKGEIILMDLGVLKRVGEPSFSDEDEKQFVGTLRYAPPEFLKREESDTKDGWKAVNLYQIGAVLHDLLMQKELFKDRSPYPVLVLAIFEDAPKISAENYPYKVNQLARDLLHKDWRTRIKLCNDKRIENDLSSFNQETDQIEIDNIFGELSSISQNNEKKLDSIASIRRTEVERRKIASDISSEIEKFIVDCFNFIKEKDCYDEIICYPSFQLEKDVSELRVYKTHLIAVIKSGIDKGFPKPLYFIFDIENDENKYGKIECYSTFYKIKKEFHILYESISDDHTINSKNAENIFNRISYDDIFKYFVRENSTSSDYSRKNIKFNFTGTFELDKSFKDKIVIDILKLIRTSVQSASDEVKIMLEISEEEEIKKAREDIKKISNSIHNHTDEK